MKMEEGRKHNTEHVASITERERERERLDLSLSHTLIQRNDLLTP